MAIDYQRVTITELSESLKARAVSAQEVAKSFSGSKDTLKLAKQVDGDIKRERFRGPLQGIPFSTSGLSADATVVARLEKIGGFLVESGIYSIGLKAPAPVSLTATYGLVSRHGLAQRAWTMDSVTLSCRTPEDCGLVLQGIAGGDSEDSSSVHKSFYYTPQYARAFTDLRVGYILPPAPSIWSGLGVKMVEAKLPELPYAAIAQTIFACEGASAYESQIQTGEIDRMVDAQHALLFRAGLQIPAKEYLKAQRIRGMLQKEMRKLFSELDAVVLPDETPARLAGLPTLSLSAGGKNTLLAGPIYTENTLLALGRSFGNRRHKMSPVLRVSLATPGGERKTFSFTAPFQIGRVPECEVFINEDHVSRNHARVFFDGAQWIVEDLKSANGLYLGDKRVDRLPVGQGTTFRLGIAGTFVTMEVLKPEVLKPEAPPLVAELLSQTPRKAVGEPLRPVPKDVDRYFKETPGETVGDHTVMVRRAFQQVQKKQRGKYIAIVAAVALVAIGLGTYAFYEHRQVAKQKALAEDIFYAMKSLDVEIAAHPAPSFQQKRQSMEKSYDQFLGNLHIYDPKMTEQDRLILRVARIFGECEIAMPPGFAAEVKEYVKKWQGSSRFKNDIRLARQKGYVKTIPAAMLAQALPPQFFYLALQESNFDEYISGPMTRMGIAKGMWQFIPQTAVKYGLKIGPLADLPRADVGDDRHNYVKATEAATQYLKELYTTDAQASGLLVMACYNWGEDYVLPLVRKMPANPKDRNFWKLLEISKEKLPKETYDYVFYIFSAAVIGENPRLFGFDFDNPLDG